MKKILLVLIIALSFTSFREKQLLIEMPVEHCFEFEEDRTTYINTITTMCNNAGWSLTQAHSWTKSYAHGGYNIYCFRAVIIATA